jgi:hypothetical protein
VNSTHLEDRIRRGLKDIEHFDLDSTVAYSRTRARPQRWLLTGAVVAIGVLTVGLSLRAGSRSTDVRFADGALGVTEDSALRDPLAAVPAVEYYSGPLEVELGTVEGNPLFAVDRAIYAAQYGCTGISAVSAALRSDPNAAALPVARFVQMYGTGEVLLNQFGMGACGPTRPVPMEVSEGRDDIATLMRQLTQTSGWQQVLQEEQKCLAGRWVELNQRLAELMSWETGQATEAQLAAARAADIEVGLEQFRCNVTRYKRRRILEADAVASFLADPARKERFEAVARFVMSSVVRLPG